jgi:hypothetical protein
MHGLRLVHQFWERPIEQRFNRVNAPAFSAGLGGLGGLWGLWGRRAVQGDGLFYNVGHGLFSL